MGLIVFGILAVIAYRINGWRGVGYLIVGWIAVYVLIVLLLLAG